MPVRRRRYRCCRCCWPPSSSEASSLSLSLEFCVQQQQPRKISLGLSPKCKRQAEKKWGRGRPLGGTQTSTELLELIAWQEEKKNRKGTTRPTLGPRKQRETVGDCRGEIRKPILGMYSRTGFPIPRASFHHRRKQAPFHWLWSARGAQGLATLHACTAQSLCTACMQLSFSEKGLVDIVTGLIAVCRTPPPPPLLRIEDSFFGSSAFALELLHFGSILQRYYYWLDKRLIMIIIMMASNKGELDPSRARVRVSVLAV